MKKKSKLKILLYIFCIILLCRVIYPHTRFSHTENIKMLGSKHLNKLSMTLKVGESFNLYISGINKRVTYTSSDFKVASVNIFTGKVSAHRKGTAIITVKQNNKRYTCKVTVIE